ncbi:MAG: HD domain-containing phosphohydrolase [Thermodesulfobacteriota bacterium]
MSHSEDRLLLKSLLVLGSVIEARDAYTGGHAWRVAQFAKLLAEKAGLGASQASLAALGGYVHDLGKVGVSDAILHKAAPLTGAEVEAMRAHPAIGRGLVADHPLGKLVLDSVYRHHERFDGQGYPEAVGPSGLELYPRIVSVADALDAMTSTRPYRQALDLPEAVSRLRAERDRQFDGRLVDAMAAMAQEGRLAGIIGHSDHETPLVRCPRCGPVIAVARTAQDGDTVHCRVCRAKHRLHAAGKTFEVEFLDERALAVALEPELEQIHGLLRELPDRLSP